MFRLTLLNSKSSQEYLGAQRWTIILSQKKSSIHQDAGMKVNKSCHLTLKIVQRTTNANATRCITSGLLLTSPLIAPEGIGRFRVIYTPEWMDLSFIPSFIPFIWVGIFATALRRHLGSTNWEKRGWKRPMRWWGYNWELYPPDSTSIYDEHGM